MMSNDTVFLPTWMNQVSHGLVPGGRHHGRDAHYLLLRFDLEEGLRLRLGHVQGHVSQVAEYLGSRVNKELVVDLVARRLPGLELSVERGVTPYREREVG